jgi:molecular chaperone DnaK (HSP70)
VDEHIILRKFKLKLTDTNDRSNDVEQDESNDGNDLTSLGKDEYLNVTATIDYLRKMNDGTYEQIKEDQKSVETGNKEVLDKSKIRYILTCPAQWNDDDRAAMRIMAKDAGIITKDDHENRLIIINESFAATLFCETEIEPGVREDAFKEGNKYLVCDAGGGTVDLATYESTSVFDKNKNTQIIGRCQLTTDSGQMCGSAFIDNNMEDLLLDIMFHGSDPSERQKHSRYISSLMVQFIEKLKVCTV